jgi:hypothetical protein
MENDYITPTETVLLMGLLTAPTIILGLILQVLFYKYKHLFIRKNSLSLLLSLSITPILVIILSFFLWKIFPMLAVGVLEDIGKKLFMPAIIVSIIIYPLTSWLTYGICKKN